MISTWLFSYLSCLNTSNLVAIILHYVWTSSSIDNSRLDLFAVILISRWLERSWLIVKICFIGLSSLLQQAKFLIKLSRVLWNSSTLSSKNIRRLTYLILVQQGELLLLFLHLYYKALLLTSTWFSSTSTGRQLNLMLLLALKQNGLLLSPIVIHITIDEPTVWVISMRLERDITSNLIVWFIV